MLSKRRSEMFGFQKVVSPRSLFRCTISGGLGRNIGVILGFKKHFTEAKKKGWRVTI
ncbi:MAG: hypothetical protein ACYCPP_07460 [Nitrososphaerales archaeon]